MHSWMDWFLLGCATLMNTILSLFCGSLLTSRCKWLHVLLCTLFVPALLIPLEVLGIADLSAAHPLRTCATLVFLPAVTILIFQDSLTKKLLVLFLGGILPVFAQIIAALPFALHGYFDFSPSYTERNGYFLLAMAATCFTYGVFCFLTSYWIRHRKLTGSSFKLMVCFVIVQSILLNGAAAKSYWDGMVGGLSEWFALVAVCAVSDLAVFYILKEMDRKIRLEAEARFFEKQLSMQLDLYRNFAAYTDGLLQVRRRLARELSQVCTALDCGDYRRVLDESRHLQRDLENLKLSGYCKNSLLNAVLFMKQREMEAQEISFAPVVQLEESTFVKRSDLCRIVSNLLDNAMEACAAVPVQSRLIRFTCMPVKHTLLIKTVNPFSGSRLSGETGLPRSTKKELGHGYGLSSISELISSYEGTLDFQPDEETGQASVTVTLFEG